MQSSGQWMDSKNLVCHAWHNKRRRALLLLYPEIKVILKKDKNQYTPLKSLVFVIFAQIFFATLLSGFSAAHGFVWAFVLCLLLSLTLGAWLMFLAQKLVHDCSHQETSRRPAIFAALVVDMLYCDGGPCFALYYFKYHLLHHKMVGSRSDSCIPLHQNWSVLPQALTSSVLGRYLWLCIIGLFTTELLIIQNVLLSFRLIRSESLFQVYRDNFVEFYLTAALKVVFGVVVWSVLGLIPYLFLRLSAGFALGAFAHPFVGFFLLQHAAVRSSHYQPTVSYAGKRWWQRLNAWELLHVEHHDFPRASPKALARIHQRCRPAYEGLHQVRSIRQLIWSWLTLTDGSAWSDFAAHQYQSACRRR